jgi:hypothetical protein
MSVKQIFLFLTIIISLHSFAQQSRWELGDNNSIAWKIAKTDPDQSPDRAMAFRCTDDPHHLTHLALAAVDGHLGHRFVVRFR